MTIATTGEIDTANTYINNIDNRYGYNDSLLVKKNNSPWNSKKTAALILALLLIVAVWFALDQKLLLGDSWISNTYDNPDWKTNEGNLPTYGAWDLETHIWKTEYIMNNYPNYHWNQYWYLGMPLIKYYQPGFYALNILFMKITNINAARSALLLIVFGHLFATLLTFLLAYKLSRKVWVSALSSIFVLSNTFLSLRSYGWEPITVIFLFLYPLGLYIFLKKPLKPFRFALIITLAAAYLSHPLLWFSLCMFIGLYLLFIAMRKNSSNEIQSIHYIWHFLGVVVLSLLIGGIQFLPQLTYNQATSGAHMGIQYLPFYQVPPNIITLKDFFFDAGNLKGPGPIIMIATLLLLIFAYMHYFGKHRKLYSEKKVQIHHHELVAGIALVLFFMVLFYYLEFYNIFPMNILRSVQYHRIIPEFLITAAILVAAMSNMIYSYRQKVIYYSLLISFVVASGIVIYFVQTQWVTSSEINTREEFIYDEITGRISMPYPDQSLAVRNSFTLQDQVYGYYEQGITNTYADEIFSVSSGYHNANLTSIYLKAANVERLYLNTKEGERDRIITLRLNGTMPFFNENNSRYAYFDVGLVNPELVQIVDKIQAENVQTLEPGCRVLFEDEYCGSRKEEFVSTDTKEIEYLQSYVTLTETPINNVSAEIIMSDPDHYIINVENANSNSAVLVKMTHDSSFSAIINGEKIPISTIGPDFMLLTPNLEGNYSIELNYTPGTLLIAGTILSILTFLSLIVIFAIRKYHSIEIKKRQNEMNNGQNDGQKGSVKKQKETQNGQKETNGKQPYLRPNRGDMK